MIRKVVIVMLTLAAIGTVGVAVASFWMPLTWRSGPSTVVAAWSTEAPVRSTVKGGVLRGSYRFGPNEVLQINGASVLVPRSFTRLGLAGNPTGDGSFMSLPSFQNGALPLWPNRVLRWAHGELPLWCPFLLFGTYPVVAFIFGPLRRYRRRKRGLCLKCGYNLTGNVSGVCPECGTKVDRQ